MRQSALTPAMEREVRVFWIK